jgi:PKD repeat protein
VVRAPVAPDVMPSGQVKLTVYAVPIGDDAAQLAPGVDAKPRSVAVELVPVLGPNAPDRLPVVDFTVSPPIANVNETVTFDASLTRDEGVLCGDVCTYRWDFGSGVKVQIGRIVTMQFPTSGTFPFTLHVTDARGFTASKSGSVKINAPAFPTANFFVIPVSPRVLNNATFDASSSTVGLGANIVSYVWDFGEAGAIGSGKVATYAYNVAGSKTVTLTVTDDLGRVDQHQLSLTVVP